MIRRSLRMGLLLGVLGAVAFALAKVLGPRSAEPLALPAGQREPWPRLTTDPGVGAAPIARPVPDPMASPPPKNPTAAKSAPAKRAPRKKAATAKAWVEPSGGVCPTTHPVKAKLASKIFHLPGMMNYERTSPDRCYADAATAEADGLRAAKR